MQIRCAHARMIALAKAIVMMVFVDVLKVLELLTVNIIAVLMDVMVVESVRMVTVSVKRDTLGSIVLSEDVRIVVMDVACVELIHMIVFV